MAVRTFEIGSRYVTDRNRQGHRVRNLVRRGRYYSWGVGAGQRLAEIYKSAVYAVTNHMLRTKEGGVIYLRPIINGVPQDKAMVRLYQVKWGHDNRPFSMFYEPEGERLRLQARLPQRILRG